MNLSHMFHGPNSGYVLELYERYLQDPDSVDPEIRALFEKWNPPVFIKSDNGSEFIAKKILDWLPRVGVKTHYIASGSPWQNGHSESFNGVFRDGCLDVWLFYSVQESRQVIMSGSMNITLTAHPEPSLE